MSLGYPVDLKTLISGENQSLGALEVIDGVGEYEFVSTGTSAVLGSTGAAGDYIGKLICIVESSVSSLVTLEDGSGSKMTILPGNQNKGTYVVPLGIKSTSGAWKVTTDGAVRVMATGAFT
ncbi:MAG: hypothetical protein KGO50_19365 [Myxococcales bacterium]|nr:hypothetical protein [Myxococcales bacterium]